jgi:hypothetical protein
MKNNAVKILAIVLTVAGTLALVYMGYSMVSAITVNAIGEPARAEVVGDAPEDALEGFEDFTKGDPAFNLGVNIYGKTIFVDNTAALKATSEKCDKAIQEMRSQAPELRAFKKGSIYVYANYIWQINWDDVNEEVFLQRQFLSQFLKYYENGDPHQ